MKIAFAGKGGVGKTTLTAWFAEYLARKGHDVWLIDADTALSLGVASGLAPEYIPVPLALRKDIILERIGQGLISLTPMVEDLPEQLAISLPVSATNGKQGTKHLLVMGNIASGGGGCACEANALLKALLAHLVLEKNAYVLVDLEAGVEHLGRGTVSGVDALVVVTEPSIRSLTVANSVCQLASELNLHKHILAVNSFDGAAPLPALPYLPQQRVFFPLCPSLTARKLTSGSVLDLAEHAQLEAALAELYALCSQEAIRNT